ncbi:MAG: heme ABC transporter ATP-binding protein [Candidatus Hydrogenedentes bacterium]|nr:heme ABC transporter ATP-binding protein [Candidatus Hydrogenedentota bacterium]
MLSVDRVGYRVESRWLVRDVSLHADPGEFWVIAGANGSGKSTLVRMLSGELEPASGTVTLEGTPVSTIAIEELARIRACLAQEMNTGFPFTAYEVTLMGRTPWHGGWAFSGEDHRVAAGAMGDLGVTDLAQRTYPTLSGGERRRVDMARVAAQQPRLLLLDEPTNHLDALHQIELMVWCRQFADEGGCVVAVLHDLNLAASYADRMLLLNSGKSAALGDPESVLTPENIRTCFGLECVIWRHPSGCPWVVPIGAANSSTKESPVWGLTTSHQGVTL